MEDVGLYFMGGIRRSANLLGPPGDIGMLGKRLMGLSQRMELWAKHRAATDLYVVRLDSLPYRTMLMLRYNRL